MTDFGDVLEGLGLNGEYGPEFLLGFISAFLVLLIFTSGLNIMPSDPFLIQESDTLTVNPENTFEGIVRCESTPTILYEQKFDCEKEPDGREEWSIENPDYTLNFRTIESEPRHVELEINHNSREDLVKLDKSYEGSRVSLNGFMTKIESVNGQAVTFRILRLSKPTITVQATFAIGLLLLIAGLTVFSLARLGEKSKPKDAS